ncbi:hypothetical protein GCM10027345_18820 [Hymenobacter daeguensis]
MSSDLLPLRPAKASSESSCDWHQPKLAGVVLAQVLPVRGGKYSAVGWARAGLGAKSRADKNPNKSNRFFIAVKVLLSVSEWLVPE